MTARYLSVKDVAAYLGRSEGAIRQLVFKRHIPFIRTGRRISFDQTKVDKWMGNGAVGAE